MLLLLLPPFSSGIYCLAAASLQLLIGRPVQKKDGEEAKSLATAEFLHLMKQLLRDAQAAYADTPSAFPRGIAISLDNASWHKAWQSSPPAGVEVRLVPPCSPDIHKVVEHPLRPFVVNFNSAYTRQTKVKTCEGRMSIASEVLHQTTADSIWRDIQSLPATLRSIIANGGDWADRNLC